MSFALTSHRHGKSKVRVARVWRKGPKHSISEWSLDISLYSKCAEAFTAEDNSNVVATDTIKNTVYAIAKESKEEIPLEEFGLALARHFVNYYSMVTGVIIQMKEKPWDNIHIDGGAHDHGFKLGSGTHTALVEMEKSGTYTVTSGIEELALLKTTQAGFENFVQDKYRLLPDTKERILASSVTCTWKFSSKPRCYAEAFQTAKLALLRTFFGPNKGGVYSPSVQSTLYLMGCSILKSVREVETVSLNMPNLHFLPVNMPGIGIIFDDDVYLPTSEPHGSIEATVSRKAVSRL